MCLTSVQSSFSSTSVLVLEQESHISFNLSTQRHLRYCANCQRRAEEADISNPSVLLTAFTRTADFNMSGTTFHFLLKLPRSLKPPFQRHGDNMDAVECELFNAEIINH